MRTDFTRPAILVIGCWLIQKDEEKAIWGDLHAYGNLFIFNSVGDWHQTGRDPAKTDEKALVFTSAARLLNLKQVYIFRMDSSEVRLNEAAQAYVDEWVR